MRFIDNRCMTSSWRCIPMCMSVRGTKFKLWRKYRCNYFIVQNRAYQQNMFNNLIYYFKLYFLIEPTLMMLYELNKEEFTKMFHISKVFYLQSKSVSCELKRMKVNDDSVISQCEVDMILWNESNTWMRHLDMWCEDPDVDWYVRSRYYVKNHQIRRFV